jgi:putative spermidine/putrescine transport system substrate-binding protein
MHDAGVVDAIDYAKLKNAANLLASMKYSYGVGHIYSGKLVSTILQADQPGAQELR